MLDHEDYGNRRAACAGDSSNASVSELAANWDLASLALDAL
jgi:hypothetical protein